MPNPLLAVLSPDGKNAIALGRTGQGSTPASALRNLADQLLKAGIDPELPLNVCYGTNYIIVARIKSITDAAKPETYTYRLLGQLAPSAKAAGRPTKAAA